MAAFGTEFMPTMAQSHYQNGLWTRPTIVPLNTLQLHPGAHVLHYASTCFEGLKAFRHQDGSVHIFRLPANIARMQQSSRLLGMPEPDTQMLEQMIIDLLKQYLDKVPEPPGSMYIRPTHIGTEATIGKAAAPTSESLLYVLLSPVGDYFAGGAKPLRLLLETENMRCAAHMGMIKGGGNYASALPHILQAQREHKADQVLFCPGGDVQETGAANFLLIDGNEVITRSLDSSFLHGITRASILTLAADLGMSVSERELSVEELIERAAKPHCEAALSGTAAVLAPVGALLYKGREIQVGTGQLGPTTERLRSALNAVQWGQSPDRHGWLTNVER